MQKWDAPVLLIIWLPSISLILELFPYTREWGNLFFKSAVSLSIVAIASYAMVSQSFINWKAMQNVGARRIMRAILIDVNTILFCSDKIINKLPNNSCIPNNFW